MDVCVAVVVCKGGREPGWMRAGVVCESVQDCVHACVPAPAVARQLLLQATASSQVLPPPPTAHRHDPLHRPLLLGAAAALEHLRMVQAGSS